MIFNFERFAGKTAFIADEKKISYDFLNGTLEKISSKIPERSLVFCLMENSFGALSGYLSFLNYDHVPLLLNNKMEENLLYQLIGQYEPRYLWAPVDSGHKFPDYKPVFQIYDYSLLIYQKDINYKIHPDLSLLLPTSGSTGSPKLVRQSKNNLKTNIAAICEYLELDGSSTAITTLPLYYTYGLSVVNTNLWTGGTIVISSHSILDNVFWEKVQYHKVTALSGVPYTWEMAKIIGIMDMSLPNLVLCDQAGGKLEPGLQSEYVNWADKTGRKFIVMYGQTEASPRMGYLPWEYAKIKTGYMGIPVPGGSFRLIDDEGQDITSANEVGELIYEGPNVAMGYATSPLDLEKGDEWNGILRTGDMASFDEDQFYRITGRKGRFLKLFGQRVSLDSIDSMIRKEFPELEFACGGKDDMLAIFTVGDNDLFPIKNYLSKKTGIHSSAFVLRKLDKLPRNEYGKINYSKLNV